LRNDLLVREDAATGVSILRVAITPERLPSFFRVNLTFDVKYCSLSHEEQSSYFAARLLRMGAIAKRMLGQNIS
jgi:hypothetical protein